MKPFFYLLPAVALLALTPVCEVFAQQVQGVVYGHDSLPMPGAAVTNIRSKATRLTDVSGRFTLPALIGDTLVVQALGHLPHPVVAEAEMSGIYLRPKIEQLAGVEVRQRRRQQDSLEDRENFRAAFNFRRPKFREVMLITPVGIGVNIQQLYRALSFSSNRQKSTFRRRLIAHEQAQFTGGRFNDSLVARHTGLRGDSLILFMNGFQPTYRFAADASDYDFIVYIRQACDSFRLGLTRPGGLR